MPVRRLIRSDSATACCGFLPSLTAFKITADMARLSAQVGSLMRHSATCMLQPQRQGWPRSASSAAFFCAGVRPERLTSGMTVAVCHASGFFGVCAKAKERQRTTEARRSSITPLSRLFHRNSGPQYTPAFIFGPALGRWHPPSLDPHPPRAQLRFGARACQGQFRAIWALPAGSARFRRGLGRTRIPGDPSRPTVHRV